MLKKVVTLISRFLFTSNKTVMKHITLVYLTLVYFQICYPQNLNKMTASIGTTNGAGLYVDDVEQIPDESARVIAYSYFYYAGDYEKIALVKLGQNGNILFNKSFSLPSANLYCQQILYYNNEINLLFNVRDNPATPLIYKTVVARINKTTGDILSAELYDGFFDNSVNHVRSTAFEVSSNTVGIIGYGYYGEPGVLEVRGKAYFMFKNNQTSGFHKAWQLSKPLKPTSIFYPKTIGISHSYYDPNNGYPINNINFDFAGIYEELDSDGSRRAFYNYHQQTNSYSSDSKMTFKIDNTPPFNVLIGYWDGKLYCWGQNYNNYPTGVYGDVFYGRFAWGTSTIKTYRNPYFYLMHDSYSSKGTYGSYAGSGINFFPFCGQYESIDGNHGYVNGKFGYNINPETMFENSKFNLNIDPGVPFYAIGVDKHNNSNKIAGIATRAGTAPNKFYYFYENGSTCNEPIVFDEATKTFESTVDNEFRVTEVSLTITPFSIDVSNGPQLTNEDICFDTYPLSDGKTSDQSYEYSYSRAELPLNINSWRKNTKNKFRGSAKTKQPILAISASKLNIYPNPTTNNIVLESGKEIITMFQIIDSKGEIIMSKSNITKSTITINMRDFSKGIYFIRYSINGTFKSEKIIYH